MLSKFEALESAIGSLSLGVLALDKSGNVLFLNQATTDLLGVSETPLDLGNWTEHYGIFLPDGISLCPAAQSPPVRAIAGETSNNFEIFVQNRVGNPRTLWCSIDFRPWHDANNEIIGAILLIQNITEQKKLADEVIRSNTALQQFATVAAHDLQEPLRSISGFAEILTQYQTDRLDEKSARCLKKINDGIRRMQTLINDLLTFSRIQTKPQIIHDTDCNKIIADCKKSLNGSINNAGAQIYADPLPTVRADSSQMSQLFQNLIGNSIKFCPSDRSPSVHISAKRQGAFWLFAVEDNGIGIQPEFKERIFGVFQRLHNKAEYSGTGIGLAICQMIVDRHGGRIWVEPNVPNGCIFYFVLPASLEEN